MCEKEPDKIEKSNLSSQLFKLLSTKVIEENDLESIVEIVKHLVDNSYVRTHALLTSWIKEYTESGLLEEKELNQLIESLPWRYDQSLKIIAKLITIGFLTTNRRSDKKKVVSLNLTNGLSKSNDLFNLLAYYSKFSHVEKFNLENLSNLLHKYHRCAKKFNALEKIKIQFNRKKHCIVQASDNAANDFIDDLTSAYLVRQEDDPVNPLNRLVKVLCVNPLLCKGLMKGDL